MHGILRSMEDNMKILSCIFISVIVFISPKVISDDAFKNEFATKGVISNEIVERKKDIQILEDSIVIRNTNPLFENISGVPGVGNFIFEKIPNKLKYILNNKTQSTEVSIYESGFRLVEIPGKSNLITDGSFVVFFKNSEDKQQFNLDYNLLPKYEMSNASTYKSDNFKTLQTLLDMLENDERVQLVELDLIDPYIVLQ